MIFKKAPATNGEPWTSVFLSCTLLGMWTPEHVDKIYILHDGKTRRWSDRIISARTNEYIRVRVSLLALDIPVTRHQALLHQAGFLSQCHFFLSLKANLAERRLLNCVHVFV